MTSTTNIPNTLEELQQLRNSVMADYIHAREMEQDREDDEDYTPGNSGNLMAILRAIDAKIATLPSVPADTSPDIDPENPMTWPPLSSQGVTKEMAYRRGKIMFSYPGGVHPDHIDAHGFISDITRAYRRGWEDAEREAQQQ